MRRKTRRWDETRNETEPPTPRQEWIPGRWQLVSSRAVLISSSLRLSPRLPPRSVAPRLVVSFGSPFHPPPAQLVVSRLVPVLSVRPVHLVISSCSLAVFIVIPSVLAPFMEEDWRRGW